MLLQMEYTSTLPSWGLTLPVLTPITTFIKGLCSCCWRAADGQAAVVSDVLACVLGPLPFLPFVQGQFLSHTLFKQVWLSLHVKLYIVAIYSLSGVGFINKIAATKHTSQLFL